MSLCNLCGEPMPVGEEMFQYHGYSGPCPKEPLPPAERPVSPPCSECERLKVERDRLKAENAQLRADLVNMTAERDMYEGSNAAHAADAMRFKKERDQFEVDLVTHTARWEWLKAQIIDLQTYPSGESSYSDLKWLLKKMDNLATPESDGPAQSGGNEESRRLRSGTTPAVASLGVREAFRAGFLATVPTSGVPEWTFDGPSAADREPEAWAAWLEALAIATPETGKEQE